MNDIKFLKKLNLSEYTLVIIKVNFNLYFKDSKQKLEIEKINKIFSSDN